MNQAFDDEAIARLLAQSPDVNPSPACSFETLWRGAESRMARAAAVRRRGLAIGAAATLLGLLLAGSWRLPRPARPAPVARIAPARQPAAWALVPDEPPTLPWRSQVLFAQWRAPTDFLTDAGSMDAAVPRF